MQWHSCDLQLMRMMRIRGARCCPDRDAHDPWPQPKVMMPGCGLVISVRYTGAVWADAHNARLRRLGRLNYHGVELIDAHDAWLRCEMGRVRHISQVLADADHAG